MTETFLVEMRDGTLFRKAAADLQPEDKVVFDDTELDLVAAQSALEAEISAAGGLEAWRQR